MSSGKFHIGNVVRNKSDRRLAVVAVSEENRYVLIPLDCHNVSYHPQGTQTFRKDTCGCYIGQRVPDDECETCKGTGEVTRQNIWIGDWEFESSCVEEFILKGVKKQFGLE